MEGFDRSIREWPGDLKVHEITTLAAESPLIVGAGYAGICR